VRALRTDKKPRSCRVVGGDSSKDVEERNRLCHSLVLSNAVEGGRAIVVDKQQPILIEVATPDAMDVVRERKGSHALWTDRTGFNVACGEICR
jgi:hypothetical protein